MGRHANLFKEILRERAGGDGGKQTTRGVTTKRDSDDSRLINLDRLDANVSALIKNILEAHQVEMFYLYL